MNANAPPKGDDYCPGIVAHAPVVPPGAIKPSTVLAMSGAHQAPHLAPALALRAPVLALAQAAEDAALRPCDPGGWPHPLRAALASRVARLNKEIELADHYLAQAEGQGHLADPAFAGRDAVMRATLRFVDGMAQDPRDTEGQDLARLRAEGISTPDVVRLAELVAFLSGQLRLVAGLRLLAKGAG